MTNSVPRTPRTEVGVWKSTDSGVRLAILPEATDSVPLVASWDFAASKRAGSKEKLQLKARYFGPIRAPIRKGEALGELVVLSADGKKQVLPLIAGTSVRQASFFGRAWNGARALVGM